MPSSGSGSASGIVTPPVVSSQYPTGSDLDAYIRSLDVLMPDTIDEVLSGMNLDAKAASAAALWEQTVNWNPFISATQTRFFDPVNGRTYSPTGGYLLRFYAGATAVTTVTAGVALDNPGVVLTEGLDYTLWPYNALQQGKPYRGIEFYLLHGGYVGFRRRIRVDGDFGFCNVIPDDVWDACLKEGVRLAFGELQGQISGGLYSRRDLNTEIRYGGAGITPLSVAMTEWKADFAQRTRLYMREEY